MSAADPVLETVRAAVRAAAPAFTGDDTTELILERVLDSLALVGVVARLEHELGVSIRDTEVLPRNFHSVTAIRAFLATKGR
ncbi:phosphopantetheine-binding protein [Kitasatospora cineracea]|uniref:Phosphopantetheine binding protein n=1 Tax=Kitasatospora cineracea TaxID=88074 RepID=A0A8G1UFQ4_9ACTN|nr:phosphopantetheine-binding protein [Kitasatospora cineracea]ROR37431.1 phosphopantetheine binding protein [Kitasatospora cineracea]